MIQLLNQLSESSPHVGCDEACYFLTEKLEGLEEEEEEEEYFSFSGAGQPMRMQITQKHNLNFLIF